MPWAHNPGGDSPEARWVWWDHPDTPPAPARVVWPGDPRHQLHVDPAAGEALRVAGQVIDGIHALVADALAELQRLEREDRRW